MTSIGMTLFFAASFDRARRKSISMLSARFPRSFREKKYSGAPDATICIDGMIPQEFADRVVFRPFAPALVSDVYLAWRKNATLSPAASALVDAVRRMSAK